MGMLYLLDKKKKGVFPARAIENTDEIKALVHPIRKKILGMLAEKENYPFQLSKDLRMHEQKIYYHIRILEKHGFIERVKKSHVGMPEFYSIKKTAFAFVPPYVKPVEYDADLREYFKMPRLVEGFVEGQKINCKIVVGAAVPHGSLNRSMRSGYLAGEIAAVLGRYGFADDKICCTDVDVKGVKDNLIVIGGIHVNTVQKIFNDHLPIRFNKTGTKIISDVSNEEYSEPEAGFICKMRNPFDKSKFILVLAGIESAGTHAAVLAFVKYTGRIEKGNMRNKDIIAKVVEGVEQNGEITDIRFME